MLSISLFIFSVFCFSQEPNTIKIIAQEDHDLYGATFASEQISVRASEQSLYRDSTDLLSLVSNTTISGGTNRIRFLQMRGVGEVSQYENTPTQSISYLVEGVDVSGVLAHWPILDTKNLYVEKQPSSVLYGGFAVGGVVETHLQRADKGAQWRATVDSRKGHGLGVSAPIADHRFSVHYNNEPGYINNIYLNRKGNSRREVYSSLVSDWNISGPWALQST
ncbi:MAG: TonB-dependent receptor plug domain-containing protein, partial [Bdellovibrionaceae bacterium]|nr:TonB-dependent receptor plug domain-containing protein [Pseudobdellovibrionaceae bacterium]